MHIHVIYEDGVLKPLAPLDIKEHEELEIIIKEKVSAARMSQGIVKGAPDVVKDVAVNPMFSTMEE